MWFILKIYCEVEKWLTHRAHNPKISGSNPDLATNTLADLNLAPTEFGLDGYYGTIVIWR